MVCESRRAVETGHVRDCGKPVERQGKRLAGSGIDGFGESFAGCAD